MLPCRQDGLEETLLENQRQMIYCMREGYYKSQQLIQDREEGNYDPEGRTTPNLSRLRLTHFCCSLLDKVETNIKRYD